MSAREHIAEERSRAYARTATQMRIAHDALDDALRENRDHALGLDILNPAPLLEQLAALRKQFDREAGA